MQSSIPAELLVAALVTVLGAAVLGYVGQGRTGGIMLALASLLASGVTVGMTALGAGLADGVGAWIGLVVGIVAGGLVAVRLLAMLVGPKSMRFVLAMWLAYCALVVFGYLSGGWLGFVTVTLPTVLMFWITLYRVAARTLPLSDRSQRRKAFRALMTYTLGTNYPYYFIEDAQAKERVPGNPYGQFFAGPGIVYADADHAAYVTDGIEVKGVYEPGLNFTEMFDQPPRALDLRSQLRAFDVHALTRDGIPICVLVFAPFRIHTGGRSPSLGSSFPFRHRAVHDIVAQELYERKRARKAGGERHEWNGTLAKTLVTPIVQDVIGKYRFDELCDIPGKDPRVEIADEIRQRVRKVFTEQGLEPVGGGISNLNPEDPDLIRRRLENWQTRWEEVILRAVSRGKAERARQIELARAEAEAEIVIKFAQVAERGLLDGPGTETALALRFIDCLGEIVSESRTQWPLPGEVKETLKELRGEIEGRR